MKKLKRFFFLSFPLAVLMMIIMAFTHADKDIINSLNSSSGAPSGYSGDPAGGNKDCTNCHGGSAAEQQAGWISSDIPETGYVPATTYTITATASGAGINKFGFQVSPQSSSGDVLGTLVNTSAETKLISGTNYVTQTSSGLSGQDSKSWTFDWIAPDAGSGEVVFYGAFNLADGNGSTSGDMIKLSTLAVIENTAVGIHRSDKPEKISVYPNPATEYMNILTPEAFTGSGFIVYNQSGKQIMKGRLTGSITTLSMENLKAGLYYLKLDECSEQTIRFVKE
jgi:hypothetical protein